MEYQLTAENPEKDLKRKLIDSEITVDEFLNEIFKRDQLTAERTDARNNIALLQDSSVQEICIRENSAEYWNAVSLALFHIGQQEAFSQNDSVALEYFREAFSAAKKIDLDEFSDWKLYLQSTKSFFEKDLESLRTFCKDISDSEYQRIPLRMITWLEADNEPDYVAVY